MIPDYTKGKESAIRILNLNKRQSAIDPQNVEGVVLVSIHKLRTFFLNIRINFKI